MREPDVLQAAGRIARPVLTLPEAEAALVRACYEAADVILEYGSGGSTVMAAEMPGKQVFAVESDRAWVQMMRKWFAENPPASPVQMIWSDIGPTRDWGHPVDDSQWRRFARYPLNVWDRDDFQHPDVVLVDGRFRAGCALATAFRITRPVVLLFDDYTTRENFHVVEAYLGRPEITGRMARFDVTPQPVPPEKLLQVTTLMTRP